jgi:hypothetical protein
MLLNHINYIISMLNKCSLKLNIKDGVRIA